MVVKTPVRIMMRDDSAQAANAVEYQGLVLPDKPRSEMPEMPQDITDLEDTTLMQLFTQLAAWGSYASSQLACAQIDERAAVLALTRAEQRALVSGWGGKTGDRLAVAKAAVAADPVVIQYGDEVETRHHFRKLTEVVVSNIDRDTALVSRELTRRTSDSRQGRKDRYTT